MTDQRLRGLERDASHGDLHARARLLLERVRVGDLPEERLRLAAYLGDEVATLVLGPAAPTSTLPTEIDTWARSLAPFGQETSVRAALGVANEFMAAWRARWPDDDRPRLAIRAAESWLRCPCSEHGLAAAAPAAEARNAATAVAGRWRYDGDAADDDDEGRWESLDPEGAVAARFAAAAAWCAANPDYELLGVAARTYPDQDLPRIRAAMIAALLSWALAPRGAST